MKNDVSVLRPKNIKELDQILLRNGAQWTFVAGGTDLLVRKQSWRQTTHIIDLTGVPELHKRIETDNRRARIGAAVPYSVVINHPFIKAHFPILCQACSQIGSIQIQNRGTIGGNIANASPAGDTLPVLAVLDADILVGPAQTGDFKRFKVNEIMKGPGQTGLQANQYIAYIEIPVLKAKNQFWAFRKIGQRAAIAISKLSLAVLGWFEEDQKIREIRIATGSVAPVISRHEKTEKILTGQFLSEKLIEQAAETIKQEIDPISDVRSTAAYRREITANVLRDVLYALLKA
ncbi:FAD binding domain-containing protein [Calditrichota bacterium LG25]